MESIQLTLSAEDIEIFRKSLDLFDKFAKIKRNPAMDSELSVS